MFVEKSALNALMDRKMNPWERKHDPSQILTLSNFLSLETPFIAQLHIPRDSELKDAAEQAGWITDVFDIGLLLLRPE